MSLLSHNELVNLVYDGVITAPHENINGASIDLTLDSIIMKESPSIPMYIDLNKKETLKMEMVDLHKHKYSRYTLLPGDFILASTNEIFNLPNNIAAEYKLKSSLARSGLQHMLAGWCDPGWTSSKLTLELYNATMYHNIMITAGMKIGQIVFWKCDPVPESASYKTKGQYNNQDKVTGSKGIR
jgi:dCTP deaminase